MKRDAVYYAKSSQMGWIVFAVAAYDVCAVYEYVYVLVPVYVYVRFTAGYVSCFRFMYMSR